MLIPQSYKCAITGKMMNIPVCISLNGKTQTIDATAIPRDYTDGIQYNSILQKEITNWKLSNPNYNDAPVIALPAEEAVPQHSFDIMVIGCETTNRKKLIQNLLCAPSTKDNSYTDKIAVKTELGEHEICLNYIQGGLTDLNLNDMGQEFRAKLRTALLVIFVVDVTISKTLDGIDELYNDFKYESNDNPSSATLVLASTNLENSNCRVVNDSQAQAVADRHGMAYFPVNANDSASISTLRTYIHQSALAQSGARNEEDITRQLYSLKSDILQRNWEVGLWGGKKYRQADGSIKLVPTGVNEVLEGIDRMSAGQQDPSLTAQQACRTFACSSSSFSLFRSKTTTQPFYEAQMAAFAKYAPS